MKYIIYLRLVTLVFLFSISTILLKAQDNNAKVDSLITLVDSDQIKSTNDLQKLEIKSGELNKIDSLKNIIPQNTIGNDLKKIRTIKDDSLTKEKIQDSLKAKASEKLQNEVLKEAEKVKELQPASEVAGYVRSIKKDSIDLDKIAEEQLKKTNYGKELDKVEQNPFKDIKSQTEKLNDQAKALQDRQQLEKYSKERASKLAKGDLAKFAPQIQTAQNEFIKYKKKAEWLKEGSEPNANSLKETPLKKRFTYGGNIQLPSLSPFTIIAAPYIGYQLNKKITSGVSVTYKFNLDNHKIFKANNVGTEYGYRIFTDYKLIKSWFAHAEFEQLNKLTKSKDSDAVHTKLQTNGYIGAGRQIEVYKGWKLNATFLVNLLHKDLMYLNPNAFQFRVGVSK